MLNTKRCYSGFTLIELMLVMTIMGGMMVSMINYKANQLRQQQVEKTALQIQQILSAALTYYNMQSAWPVACTTTGSVLTLTDLTSSSLRNLFPTLVNPYGYAYKIACNNLDTSTNTFQVEVQAPDNNTATMIAGSLPVAIVTTGSGVITANTTGTYVLASINIPGQNLNNARSVNYAGVFTHGDCVPQPSCPNNMTAQIYVAPMSIVGGDGNTSPYNVYPIVAVTAYSKAAQVRPDNCDGTTASTDCTGAVPNQKYFRVCMTVLTQAGIAQSISVEKVIAFTRCSATNEP